MYVHILIELTEPVPDIPIPDGMTYLLHNSKSGKKYYSTLAGYVENTIPSLSWAASELREMKGFVTYLRFGTEKGKYRRSRIRFRKTGAMKNSA